MHFQSKSQQVFWGTQEEDSKVFVDIQGAESSQEVPEEE